MTRIGVIGVGVVGQAIVDTLIDKKIEYSSYDKFKLDKSHATDLIFQTDFIFVSVPTPNAENGRQNIGALLEALTMLKGKYAGVVIVKSTVLPGTMNRLSEFFPDLRLVHNPEFLNEKTALEDFIAQRTVLLSGKPVDTAACEEFFKTILVLTKTYVHSENYRSTEIAKYVHNCVLAVKLSFLNEIWDICTCQDEYNEAAGMAYHFGNLGHHHAVPGPDTKLGWGGNCFPKDMKALKNFMKDIGVKNTTISGALETNRRMRT